MPMKVESVSKAPLREIPGVISWCGNFVKTWSFRRVSDDSPETLR